MAKTGRPKMQPHERRNARLPAIRLTDAERTDLELKAQAAGVDLSEWVRGQLTSLIIPQLCSNCRGLNPAETKALHVPWY